MLLDSIGLDGPGRVARPFIGVLHALQFSHHWEQALTCDMPQPWHVARQVFKIIEHAHPGRVARPMYGMLHAISMFGETLEGVPKWNALVPWRVACSNSKSPGASLPSVLHTPCLVCCTPYVWCVARQALDAMELHLLNV
ncbi:hypothetical protein S245_024817 [Arachis hypogaea]